MKSIYLICYLMCIQIANCYSQPKPEYKEIITKWYKIKLVDNWTKVWADNKADENVHLLLRHTPHDKGLTSITVTTYFKDSLEKIINARKNEIKAKIIPLNSELPDLKFHIKFEIPTEDRKQSYLNESWFFEKNGVLCEISYLTINSTEYEKFKEVVQTALHSFKLK